MIAFGAPFLVAAVGGLITVSEVPAWYATLQKPVFNPPSWVFGPVWTLLYFLMGVALFMVWQGKGKNRAVLTAFFVQLGLNLLWTIVFFGFHLLLLAVIVSALLLVAIISTIIVFAKKSKVAAALLVPYAAWTAFATVLSGSVFYLNQ